MPEKHVAAHLNAPAHERTYTPFNENVSLVIPYMKKRLSFFKRGYLVFNCLCCNRGRRPRPYLWYLIHANTSTFSVRNVFNLYPHSDL